MRHLMKAFDGRGKKGGDRYHLFDLKAHAAPNMAGMSHGRRMATLARPK